MKKFKTALILLLFLVAVPATFAQDEVVYKTAPAFVRVVTNMMGYNFIAKKVAQGVLKKALKNSAAGEYKVKIDSFSGVDLKKGMFRGLIIDGKDLCVDDELFISSIHFETTSDFNYVDYRSKPVVFMTDLPMSYNIVVTEDDLNKTFSSNKIIDVISAIIPLMSIEKPKIKLEKEKIRVSSSLKFPFVKAVKFSMSAALKVENGKIILSDVESNSQKDFTKRLVNMINRQCLFDDMDIYLFDNTNTSVSVTDVKIEDSKIFINGNLLVKKS